MEQLKKYRYISEKADVMNFDFVIFQITDTHLDIVVNNKEYNRIKKDNFTEEYNKGKIKLINKEVNG